MVIVYKELSSIPTAPMPPSPRRIVIIMRGKCETCVSTARANSNPRDRPIKDCSGQATSSTARSPLTTEPHLLVLSRTDASQERETYALPMGQSIRGTSRGTNLMARESCSRQMGQSMSETSGQDSSMVMASWSRWKEAGRAFTMKDLS